MVPLLFFVSSEISGALSASRPIFIKKLRFDVRSLIPFLEKYRALTHELTQVMNLAPM
jgi:hypothetical protein